MFSMPVPTPADLLVAANLGAFLWVARRVVGQLDELIGRVNAIDRRISTVEGRIDRWRRDSYGES